MLDTIENAIRSIVAPVDLSGVDIVWENKKADLFGDRFSSFPYVSVSCERPSVGEFTSSGTMRVSYPVQIAIMFLCDEASGTKAREIVLKQYEKLARSIVYSIGLAHSDGGTICEVDFSSISQRSSSGQSDEICESCITFNLEFDEGDYNQ